MSVFTVDLFHNITPATDPGHLAIFERCGFTSPRHAPGDLLALVVTLDLEAESAARAAGAAFDAGNSPYDGPAVRAYRAAEVRSLCVGDVVVVHTPDGPAAYACESFGWASVVLSDFVIAAA